MLRVNVTNHALVRWRERIATYANSPESELVEAVQRATPVEPDEPTPFTKYTGSRYFRHAENCHVYFVTEAVAKDYVNLITVFDCSPKVMPPQKEQQVENGKGGTKAKKDVPRFPVPDYSEPSFTTPVSDRHDFWKAVVMEAQMMLHSFHRSHPDRGAWARLVCKAQSELATMSDEYKEWRRKDHDRRQEENATEIYREDGGINYTAAFRFLLAEVKRLSDEMSELKAA